MLTVEVPFQARDAGEARLTWGQLHIWRPLTRLPEISASLNLNRMVVTDERVTLPAALLAIRSLVEENQSLRSRFGVSGEPRQRVEPVGKCIVSVLELESGEPLDAAHESLSRLTAARFELAVEWPIRFLVTVSGAQVRAVGFVVSHVAADGHAVQLLLGQLRATLLGQGPRRVNLWQPLTQASYETSELAARRSRRALARIKRHLDQAPQLAPPLAACEETNPVKYWRFHSEALVGAAQALALRNACSSASVVLTVFSLVLRASLAERVLPLRLIASNRYAPEQMRDLVAPTCQDAHFAFGMGHGTLSDAFKLVYRAASEAYANGFYDPDAYGQLLTEVERERGLGAGSPSRFYFNDARLSTDWAVAPLALSGRKELEASCERSEVVLAGALPNHDMWLCLSLSHFGGRSGLGLLADTRVVSGHECQKLLRSCERLLMEALLREVDLNEANDFIARDWPTRSDTLREERIADGY